MPGPVTRTAGLSVSEIRSVPHPDTGWGTRVFVEVFNTPLALPFPTSHNPDLIGGADVGRVPARAGATGGLSASVFLSYPESWVDGRGNGIEPA